MVDETLLIGVADVASTVSVLNLSPPVGVVDGSLDFGKFRQKFGCVLYLGATFTWVDTVFVSVEAQRWKTSNTDTHLSQFRPNVQFLFIFNLACFLAALK